MRGSSWAGKLLAVVALSLLALPAVAMGHAERPAYYPNFDPLLDEFGPAFGSPPKYRTSGPWENTRVVCTWDSRNQIENLPDPAMRGRNLDLLRRCGYRHIQEAVNAASNGDRILILPGVYRENPSRREPFEDPDCAQYKDPDNGQPTYEYHYYCPNSKNMITIAGDDPNDDDRKCDKPTEKCNLQIEGTARRHDVLVSGDRTKLNVFRLDRADGTYIRNLVAEFSDFNNFYAIETNGFVFESVDSRYSREYGFLTFVSDQGLIDNIEAWGSGDSGIYPGAGPEGHADRDAPPGTGPSNCVRYGIEIKNSNSHHNNMGLSSTAGNGVWAHDNRFHHNASGMITDSFVPNHPGMPQDCAKWENNQVYSNNMDLFTEKRNAYCDPERKPAHERDPKKLCSTFGVPVGGGMLIAGGNNNIVRGNRVWDNWRYGAALFHVPAELRGEDSTGQSAEPSNVPPDTSHGNQFTENRMGVRPNGNRDPNGVDFWWEGQGKGNCWSDNKGPGGAPPTTDFGEPYDTDPSLVACPEGSPGNPLFDPTKTSLLATCSLWSPSEYEDPPGCYMAGSSWYDKPAEPQ